MKRFRSDLDVNYDPQGDAYGDYDYVMTEEEKEYKENNEAFENDDLDEVFEDDYFKSSSYRLPKKLKAEIEDYIPNDDLIDSIESECYLNIQIAFEQGKLFEDDKNKKGKEFIQSLIFHAKTPQMVDFLVNKGLNPNVKNKEGKTFAHIVADLNRWSYTTPMDNLPILNKLMDLNVDLNVTDNKGRTPLYVLLKSAKIPSSDVILIAQRMIRLGADINQPDNSGKTLYEYAVERNKVHLIKLINLVTQTTTQPQKIASSKRPLRVRLRNRQNEKN